MHILRVLICVCLVVYVCRGDPEPALPEDPCKGTPCQNGGSCENNGGTAKCTCKPEFTGEFCDTAPCTSNPCKNDGNCSVVEDSAKCACKTGYSGDTCEITPCTSNPCKNDGNCSVVEDSAKCACKTGYSGNTCEITPCTSNPCKNYGTCSVVEDSAKCLCKTGYSGNTCEITPCTSNPCKSGGTCSVVEGSSKCACKTGYSGDTCEIAPTPCDPNPCKNEGDCFAAGANAKCVCKKRYQGERCEIDRGPCIPNPCKHHGYCIIVEPARSICACENGFTGETCEIVPTTCTSNPCQHGGHCSVVEEKAECTCINGYTGELCEIDSDPCVPDPCKHGGYCETLGGKVYCLCLPINIGERCEIETCIDESNCKNDATCEGEGDTKFCICQNGTYGGRCRTITDCVKGGKYENCSGVYGKCTFENGTAVCNCTDGDRKLDESAGQCRMPCKNDSDCLNEAKCEGGKDGVKVCDCKPGTLGETCEFITECSHYGKYKQCVDDYGECTFVNGRAVCNCHDGKKLDESEGYCKNPCDSNEDCLNEATCKGEKGGNKFCHCKPGTADDMCEYIMECGMGGKYEHCQGDDGECTFKNGSAVCKCNDGKKLDESIGRCNFIFCVPNPCKDGSECTFDNEANSGDCKCKDQNKIYDFSSNTCKDTCIDDGNCKNGAICQGKEGKKICVCQNGTYGNICQNIDDCEKGGKYENCTKDMVCTFEEGAAVCKCAGDDRKLDNSTGQCRKPCDAVTDCLNDGTCRGKNDDIKFCDCKNGTLGDTCEIVRDCEKGGKYQFCKNDSGNCKFANGKAACDCTDDKIVDENKGYCIFKFCVPSPCKDGSYCNFNEEENTGVCKCKDENKYYNYYTDKCTAPDKCIINRKEPCGENMECVNGACKCIDKFKEDNKTCIPNFCSPNPCFPGAKCDDTDGKLKCSCKEGEYFDGKKCADGSCFLGDDYKSTCKEPCPQNLEPKEDGVCKPKKDFEPCSDDCGYGYCVKKTDGNNTCSCITSIAYNREKKADGKCTLKNDVCASKNLTDDLSKCNCDGNKYKQASNGITCELLTCLDEIAQDYCKQKGAQCVMDGKKGYDCKCPTGFKMDNKKQMCADPCSLENAMTECLKKDQFCYNSISTLNDLTGDCRCPPTLKKTVDKDNNTKCAALAENVYTVTGIPVIKTKYAIEGRINHILLNADLIQSMKSTFKHFEYGYLQDYQLNGDVLNVTVWIQFNSSVNDSELNRIPLQARSFMCEDCNSDLTLWPPHVLLDKELFNASVSSEKLGFCSEISKNILCGEEAVCNENKCSCSRGYDTVYYSIRDIEEEFRIQRCEDIDECVLGTHSCTENTTCVNLPGDYYCQCKATFKKEKDPVHSRVIKDKSNCYDLCTPNPCNKGTCVLKEDKSFDCKCSVGSEGSFCDATDTYLARAKKDARIVGGVLGAILGLTLIGIFLFYRRMKKNSSSEEFSSAASQPGREMDTFERSAGAVNRGYE